MADFILEYDILESIANNSKSLGKRSKEYSEKLESKIITGIDRVAGPSSGYLTSASDSVRDKINALKLKSDAFYHFADQITNLLEVAEQIDQEVADAIAAQREYFLDHHEALRIDDWKAKLLGLIVDIKNSIPLLDTIADILDGLKAVFEALEDSIKHWYECEGGKYIVRAVGSVVVAAVSVALFVAAFPVSGFFAVCGAIGAGIAAINGITNVATSFRAADAAIDGDPAWAVIYGKQDKLSDVLRQTNFGSGGWNALSNLGAGALDTTETICDVVGFAEIGKNAIKLFKGDAFKLLKNKGSMDFSDLKNGSKSDIVDLKNNILDGYADSKNGIKEITLPKSSLGDMSVDDLTRYNKHWDDLATGAHDIPYGMNAEEYYQHLKGLDKVNDAIKGASKTIKGGSQADVLAKNRANGRAFEEAKMSEFSSGVNNAVEQITIKTNQGTKIRVDAMGTDKNTGNVIINEFKSSATAPLTKNQIKGFPELQKSGGVVVGKGKGIFTGGYQVPPTKVEIIRPNK